MKAEKNDQITGGPDNPVDDYGTPYGVTTALEAAEKLWTAGDNTGALRNVIRHLQGNKKTAKGQS